MWPGSINIRADSSTHPPTKEVEGACWIDRARINRWIEIEEAKDRILKERRVPHDTSVVKYAATPEFQAAVRNILPASTTENSVQSEEELPAIRFSDEPDGSGSSELIHYTYNMRESWLGLGHRFVLKVAL